MKVILLKIDGNTNLVSIPNYYPSPDNGIFVDGKQIEIARNEEFTCENPYDIRIIQSIKQIKHYVSDNYKIVSVESFNDRLGELASKGFYDEDECVYCFKNLEDEYEYKKYNRAHKPCFEQVTKKGGPLLVLEKLSTSETGHPNIISILSTLVREDEIGIYKLDRASNKSRVIAKLIKNLGLTSSIDGKHDTYQRPAHGEDEYFKISGEYCFAGAIIRIMRGTSSGSLEKCKAIADADEKYITDRIMIVYNTKCRNHMLDAANSGILLEYIAGIKNQVNSIDSKLKTKNKHRIAVKLILELEQKLIDIINENK